jgi:hypothetical protein
MGGLWLTNKTQVNCRKFPTKRSMSNYVIVSRLLPSPARNQSNSKPLFYRPKYYKKIPTPLPPMNQWQPRIINKYYPMRNGRKTPTVLVWSESETKPIVLIFHNNLPLWNPATHQKRIVASAPWFLDVACAYPRPIVAMSEPRHVTTPGPSRPIHGDSIGPYHFIYPMFNIAKLNWVL